MGIVRHVDNRRRRGAIARAPGGRHHRGQVDPVLTPGADAVDRDGRVVAGQRNLAQRQDQVDLYDAANQPYEQAIRLAQRGMEKDELVEVCGLSEGEADLINMLHRLDKVS